MLNRSISLESVLDKAGLQDLTNKESLLSKDDIRFLLSLRDERSLAKIYAKAREMRQKYFANHIFMYGFVYFSTYCRNNCTFCLYRRENQDLSRYRKNHKEILETALSLAESGIHLLDLTMGEDPEFLRDSPQGFGALLGMIRNIKEATGLPLMISPGVVPEKYLKALKEAGINWYALYQETHNRDLYGKMRLKQDYESRWQIKNIAHQLGFLVEEGLLTGVGDQPEDWVDSMLAMRELDAEQIRVMSFIPQINTPMADLPTPPRQHELLIIAVMRLLFPDRLIPASLDVDGISGMQERLNAGANVVTSIIPPQSGLAGVSNSSLDIAEGNRDVAKVSEILLQMGLQPATQEEYKNWVLHKQIQLQGHLKGVI